MFMAAFFLDNLEICIQPELFSWSIIFLKLSDSSITITGKIFFIYQFYWMFKEGPVSDKPYHSQSKIIIFFRKSRRN